MNKAEIPHLGELLDRCLAELPNRYNVGDHPPRCMSVHPFIQVWPNTGCGFAEPGYVYGQAFTKQYTVVITVEELEFAMVFFGDTPAYEVSEFSDAFMDDLDMHNMAGKYKARTKYPGYMEASE